MNTYKNNIIALIFLIVGFILPPVSFGEEILLPRLLPSDYIVALAQEPVPLSLDSAISASLKLSGIDPDEFGKKKDQLYALIEEVKNDVIDISSEMEKAEQVLLYLHEHIFTRYSVNQTKIDVLLDNGIYNCVSSSVLYLLCIKGIGLEIWGIKTKDHAFVRLRTEQGDFDVETTNIYGFNPGVKKDFTDQFGNLTGYSYVPPGKYNARTEVSDLELISIILQNRISYLNTKDNYYEALELAIDLYGFIQTDDSYATLVAIIGNMAHWYTKKNEYMVGINFYDSVLTLFPEDATILDVRTRLVHNYVLDLLNKKKLDLAEEFVLGRNEKNLFEADEFHELLIYIILDKANLLSRTSYEDAVNLINNSISSYGSDKRLIQIKEALVNNWIAGELDKKEWESAGELVSDLYERNEITLKQWEKFMSIIYNGQAVIIAEEEGNLAAAAYIKEAMEIIKNDKILQNNYKYYRYNYTVEIHNEVITLVNEKKYTRAIELLEQALRNVEDSSLLQEDLKKIQKMVNS